MNILKTTTMKPFNKLATIGLMTVLLVSCEDFGAINDDPNNPSEVRTELLLTNAQNSMSDVVGAFMGTLWVQYISETQYTEDQEYQTFNANFNSWYYDPLQDLETIIELNTDEETSEQVAATGGSNANQIAVARIMKAYFYQMLTDRWGPVPYSEALQGREDFSPAYDSQEEIYEDIINELKEAVDQMDDGAGVSGDILFNGNMALWAEFANSLRARAALRIADTDLSDFAENEFADAVDSGLIIEDVEYPYLADSENENPWYTRFMTRTDYAISEPIAEYMQELEDQRLTVYANPAPDEDNEDGVVTLDEIVGMPYAEIAGEIENSEISFPGSAIGAGGPGVGEQDAPLPIITVAELNFAQAEAVERGWITGSAEDFYLNGIEASWVQWGVYDADDFADYVSNAEVAYNSANWRESIGNQKWLALFPNGYEAWSEWRRLGYPDLEPNPHGLPEEDPAIPVRFTYPTTESEINAENYEAAVEMLGGEDSQYARVWWHEAAVEARD